MLPLTSTQTASLQHWFLPERPGSLVGPHVLETGNGACWVDRWPMPQAVLVKISVNHTLMGDVHAVTSRDLQPHIKGYAKTSETFLPLLWATFADVHLTPRIVLVQPAVPARFNHSVVQRYSRARPSTKLGYVPGQPGQPASRGETPVHSTAQ
jgi:hypothetical protein